jgi:hypothetical protein
VDGDQRSVVQPRIDFEIVWRAACQRAVNMFEEGTTIGVVGCECEHLIERRRGAGGHIENAIRLFRPVHVAAGDVPTPAADARQLLGVLKLPLCVMQ